MQTLYYIFIFVFGACFGSLGSVLIWRLRSDITKDVLKGVLYGRSECPSCHKILGAGELVPIFSWIFQGGKCRGCKTKISSFYPFLEVCTGLVFVFSYWFVGQYLGYFDLSNTHFILNFVFLTFTNYILLLLLFADILFFELNVLLWIILVLWTIGWQFFGQVGDFQLSAIGGIIFFLAFYLIYHFSKFYVKIRFKQADTEGFGEGDVMVALIIGLLMPFLLGVNSIYWTDFGYMAFYYLFISAFLGILFSTLSYIINRGKYGSSIPFLPAMVVGFWILQVYGVSWVHSLLNLMF